MDHDTRPSDNRYVFFLVKLLSLIYQVSVSVYVTDLSPRPSVGLCVCLFGKCTVAKRLSGSGCRWDGEWGRLRDGCIR